MEEMTKEEVKSYNRVLEKISTPTGNNFFDTVKNNKIMTQEQKKECNHKGYTNYSCDLDCLECKLSYEYVLAFYAGYKEGYKTGRSTSKPIDKENN